MEFNQVHRMMTVGLVEYVKSSTDDGIKFVHKHEDQPEKVSLTHLAKYFQEQVRIEDTTHETKTTTNTGPNDCKEDKGKA